ncbi:NAC domain-containing protein 90-like [Salvia hispanica]|uniref:NAC domain-containing protein 90-like n=1 Tax=Salvia hispanica TaxID=49212 RepID=UPI0020093D10|nr:NAC domain-containing protein 90-like [Salvia hispanica]
MGDEMPVGFRFSPTEEELVSYFLQIKLNGGPTPSIDRVIPLLPIYDYSPWDLPPEFAGELCCEGDREEWFFFTPMQEREARGGRPNRLTNTGYWKSTGSPVDIFSSQNLRIGRRRTLVFYTGRSPHGTKTSWKMNEYKMYDQSPNPQLKEELRLCRIYTGSYFPRAYGRRPAAAHHHHHITDNNQQNSEMENDLNFDMETEFEPLTNSEIRMLHDLFNI